MRVAITGATGLIGTALGESLARDGHTVHRLTRRPRITRDFVFDPGRGILDPEAFRGVDSVVHLAGEPIAQRWNRQVRERIRESRVAGTRLVSDTLAQLADAPRVLVSASAVGIYGDRGDEQLTEESAPGGDFLSAVCTQWEAAAGSARLAGVRVVHPRMGIVLSSRGGALQRLLLPFRLGLGGRIGTGTQWMSWISLDDAVSALRHVLQRDELRGAVNLVCPAPVTNAEFTRTLAGVLHRPALFPVPAFALRLAFNEMADATLMASQRVLPTRLGSTGFTFAHPELDSALRAVL